MRILLSTIGTRGDVQPLVALASQLQALGHEARLCVPPDFREWIERLGFQVIPIGPELRSFKKARQQATAPLTAERRRQMMDESVAAQFETISAAAQGCDLIVGATALQIAAPSIAERLGIPYVFASYCPAVLPSPHHAPPTYAILGDTPAVSPAEYPALWERYTERFNSSFREVLNTHRTSLGLAPIEDVRSHIFTEQPWLGCDQTLGPWPDATDSSVFQTGAWILPDERPLPAELEAFLDAGDPPVYFGYGSAGAPHDVSQMIVQAARTLGRRVVVSSGWEDLPPLDLANDLLTVGEVNQQALFACVAAVVHHGGTGTTTAAARAGAPQVVIAQHYDQHYWGQRVQELGIGVAHAPVTPTLDSLRSALEHALSAGARETALAVSKRVRSDGALVAARRCVENVLLDADPQLAHGTRSVGLRAS